MNYQKIYDSLVSRERYFGKDAYYEIHHKIPTSIGGSDEQSNLVKLTAREHYIAHALLLKISESVKDDTMIQKMAYAFNCMKWGRTDGKKVFKYNSRLYEMLKKKYSRIRSEVMKTRNPMSGKIWIHCDELRQSRCQDASKPIPRGWSIGRVLDFNSLNENEESRIRRLQRKLTLNEQKTIYADILYEHMTEHGYSSTMREFNWKGSQSALSQFIRKWSIEYVPIKQSHRKYNCL